MAVNEEESERNLLHDVPRPTGANTVLASLAAALQASGEDISYEFLMGVSSRAFRLQFCWCPSAPHSHCGFNTFDPAIKAIGYESKDYMLACWEQETRKCREATEDELNEARDAVRASIESGMPVLLNSHECSLIAGHESPSDKNPTGWLQRPGPLGPPPTDDEPYTMPVEQIPWCITTIKRSASKPPDRMESIVWSLKKAVENAHADKIGLYSTGFAAYDRWIRELADLRPVIGESQEYLDKYDSDESAPFGVQVGNAWCYESLHDARKQAAAYLRSIAGDFGEAAAEHLRAAADEYDAVVHELIDGLKCFTHLAPYPWMEDIKWDNEKRAEQAERLKKALPHERKAIDHIAVALKEEGLF
ncbi:MAG: hypothetical protein JW941_10155 [Candidatus Coatesbacteria bacterium]|nr:hypothetical protein [Candidatus Coatesbacteria bacterium]